MVRTKEEIIEILKSKNFEKEPYAKNIYYTLTESTTEEQLKKRLLMFQYGVETAVKAMEPSDFIKGVQNDPFVDKASVARAAEKEKRKRILEYNTIIADCLFEFKTDRQCMDVVKAIYSSYETTDDGWESAYENMGILYADEKCVLYDLGEAFVMLAVTANRSDDAEVVYAYAKSMEDNKLLRYDSLAMYEKALKLGCEKASVNLARLRKQYGLCLYCGCRTFKGIFTKKCTRCGKKKGY